MSSLRDIDRRVFLFLNSLAGRDLFVDRLVIFFGRDFPYLLAAGFAFYGIADYFGLFRNAFALSWATVAIAFLAGGVARMIVEIISAFYERKRPFERTEVRQLIFRNGGAAFPSGHAAFFFAFAAAVTGSDPFVGLLFLLSALAISLSRIIGGVHWPGDVFIGTIIGVVIGATTPWILFSF